MIFNLLHEFYTWYHIVPIFFCIRLLSFLELIVKGIFYMLVLRENNYSCYLIRAIPCNFFTQVNCRSQISLKFWKGICQPKKSKQPKFQLKKIFLAFLRLFYFLLPFSPNKNFFLHFLLPRAQIDRKKFSKIYNRCKISQGIDSRCQIGHPRLS